jgi:hypothetical protein
LPAAYRTFVITYGTPGTTFLLNSIVEGNHDVLDVQEFIAIEELVGATAAYESVLRSRLRHH